MTADNYKPVYLAALKELTDLLAELETLDERRDKVDSRVADVKKGVLALGSLCGEQPWVKYPELFPEMSMFASAGLTPSITTILSRPPGDWMSPVGVRDALKDVGYTGKSTNILPSVHTVLKRLFDAGKVETENRDGRTWYRWKGPVPRGSDEARALLRRFAPPSLDLTGALGGKSTVPKRGEILTRNKPITPVDGQALADTNKLLTRNKKD